MSLGSIILTGGASARMGADKAELLWLGERAVDRVAQVAMACGADPVITAGSGDYGFSNVVDDAPNGGPVGGILAAARALQATGCHRALILAVDAPLVTVDDLALLLTASGPGAAFEGLHLPMVLNSLAMPPDAVAGWPIARLIERAGLVRIVCRAGSFERLRGANTPNERRDQLRHLDSGR